MSLLFLITFLVGSAAPAAGPGVSANHSAAVEAADDAPRDVEAEPIQRRSRSAAGTADAAAKPDKPSNLLLDTLGPLAIVMLTIGGVTIVVRKLAPRGRMVAPAGAIRVVSRQEIGAKQSLALVRVGGRLVLVGVSPQGMSALTEFRDADEVAALVGAAERSRGESLSARFGAFLTTARSDYSAEKDAVTEETPVRGWSAASRAASDAAARVQRALLRRAG